MTDECSLNLQGQSIINDADDAVDANPMGVQSISPVPMPYDYKANMPTERHARDYNMNHKNRGLALIFNHEHFDIPSIKSRSGTNKDCDNLRVALESLHFNVTVHQDCRFSDIVQQVEKAARQDHTDNDCIFITILSHGEYGHIYAKDVQYKVETLSNYFTGHNCPTLAGKPKVFVIQACRGDKYDAGITLQHNHSQTDGDLQSSTFKLPRHADFLYAYSTISGYYSWRNVKDGSWFIQSLVQELNENGRKENILTLLTFVARRVAIDFESNVPNQTIMDRQKQIPCVTTMLTRLLFFTDKKSSAA